MAEAPDQLIAELWRDVLLEEGIPAHLQTGDTASFLGTLGLPCRVMVPEGKEADAIAVLSRRLTPGELEAPNDQEEEG